MVLDITSKNLDGVARVDLVALSRARTRLNVSVTLEPKSLQARLLFQSLRFARNKTTGRFSKIVARFAEDVEARYRD